MFCCLGEGGQRTGTGTGAREGKGKGQEAKGEGQVAFNETVKVEVKDPTQVIRAQGKRSRCQERQAII